MIHTLLFYLMYIYFKNMNNQYLLVSNKGFKYLVIYIDEKQIYK